MALVASGKHTPWVLILKSAEYASCEKQFLISLAFLGDDISKLHQNDKFSAYFPLCMNHDTQQSMNHITQECIASYVLFDIVEL